MTTNCEDCDNTGYIQVNCPVCQGTGESQYPGSYCRVCNGGGVSYNICTCEQGGIVKAETWR